MQNIFIHSLLKEITTKPHKVQNVTLQQMVKRTLQVRGCTVCMHSWILRRGGGFFLELTGIKSKCTEGKQWVVGVVEWRGVG